MLPMFLQNYSLQSEEMRSKSSVPNDDCDFLRKRKRNDAQLEHDRVRNRKRQMKRLNRMVMSLFIKY